MHFAASAVQLSPETPSFALRPSYRGGPGQRPRWPPRIAGRSAVGPERPRCASTSCRCSTTSTGPCRRRRLPRTPQARPATRPHAPACGGAPTPAIERAVATATRTPLPPPFAAPGDGTPHPAAAGPPAPATGVPPDLVPLAVPPRLPACPSPALRLTHPRPHLRDEYQRLHHPSPSLTSPSSRRQPGTCTTQALRLYFHCGHQESPRRRAWAPRRPGTNPSQDRSGAPQRSQGRATADQAQC